MLEVTPTAWPSDRVCFRGTPSGLAKLAAGVYRSTCRTSLDEPGFCLLDLGASLESTAFRRAMVELKEAMSALHELERGQSRVYLSAARFDQQTTTRPHLDGGPAESFLMLGYEPSEVEAVLAIADYARCARDLGLTPEEFLERHNPMFQAGLEMLRPYTTEIPCFSPTQYQIVCINNSFAPLGDEPAWQGTLHPATILNPDDTKRRVVNSTMIASAPLGSGDEISPEELAEFVQTSAVRRRGYDKSHLDDDR